jgi:hypothetical protein
MEVFRICGKNRKTGEKCCEGKKSAWIYSPYHVKIRLPL